MPKMQMAIQRNGDTKCTLAVNHDVISMCFLVKVTWWYLVSLANGCPTRWFFSESRIVYKIDGGPMAGRINFQAASYQCIRPGELWQCNWLEGSSCTLIPFPHKLTRSKQRRELSALWFWIFPRRKSRLC